MYATPSPILKVGTDASSDPIAASLWFKIKNVTVGKSTSTDSTPRSADSVFIGKSVFIPTLNSYTIFSRTNGFSMYFDIVSS